MYKNAAFWIDKHQMLPHPEGGFYKETFRSTLKVEAPWGERNALTSIFYLLENDNYSAFHRIKSDELWYYHAGETLLIHEIKPNGDLTTHHLSNENPFVAITANSWFASEVKDQSGYVLVSCSVAPGFDFSDFELANRTHLCSVYPLHKTLINRLSRSVTS
jgi:predicted cupin superfamily sugar epimerase